MFIELPTSFCEHGYLYMEMVRSYVEMVRSFMVNGSIFSGESDVYVDMGRSFLVNMDVPVLNSVYTNQSSTQWI